MRRGSSRTRDGQTSGRSIKTFAPGGYSIPFSTDIADIGSTSEQHIHGGLLPLTTGAPLNSSPVDIDVTTGQGKLVLVLNAGSDVSGTITVTGTSVDRDTGVTTPNDTDNIVVDALTIDAADTDANGNARHELTGAYITSKWFTGAVTISTADTTFTDVDVYHMSFEQVNDAPAYVLTSLDMNSQANNVLAELDVYLYAAVVTGSKVDVTREGSLNLTGVTADRIYRNREGKIGKGMDGRTDGFWVDLFNKSANKIENLTMKVWVTVVGSGTDVATKGAAGDVTAAANLTDNRVVRGDGGAKGVQTSGIIIDDSDHMGIGLTTPLSELDIKKGSPAAGSNANTLFSAVGRTTDADVLRGGRFIIERQHMAGATSNILVGLHSSAADYGDQNLTNSKWAIVGVRAAAFKSGGNAGTVASMRAFSGESEVDAGVNGITVTNCCIFVAEPVDIRGASTADHACSFWGKAHSVLSGTITHAWGVRLAKQTIGGTSNHALVLEGDGIGADIAFGVDQDALLYFDGTNLIIDPDALAEGTPVVLIGPTGNRNLKAAIIDALKLFNSAGDLKIMPDVQGDVLLFGDTDVDDAANGRAFYVYRKAAEGDVWLKLHVTAGKVAQIQTNDALFIDAADYVKIVAGNNIYLDLGDNAGVRELRVRDSDKATVASINSNGTMTLDDGLGNTVVVTPDSTAPTIAASAPNLVVTANNASSTAILQMRNATTSEATKFQVGSDAAGGTGAIDADSVTARRTNGDLTLAGSGTGGVIADGRNIGDDGGLLDNVKTRSEGFAYVTPVALTEFFLGVIPVAATATECYAICENGTSVVFTIVSRARSAPFSGGTNIVNAQTATTTGGTKTIASSTLAANNELWISFGTVTGSVDTLRVTLKHTVNA